MEFAIGSIFIASGFALGYVWMEKDRKYPFAGADDYLSGIMTGSLLTSGIIMIL